MFYVWLKFDGSSTQIDRVVLVFFVLFISKQLKKVLSKLLPDTLCEFY